MKTNTCFALLLAGFSLFLVGCNKTDIEPTTEQAVTEESATDSYLVSKDGKIVLGKKLENPYSVKNMQSAYNSLTASARVSGQSL